MSKKSSKRLIASLLAVVFVLTTAFPAMAAPRQNVLGNRPAIKATSTPNVKKGSNPISKQIRQIPNTQSAESQKRALSRKPGSKINQNQSQKKYAPDRVIVKFKQGLGIQNLGAEAAGIDLKFQKKLGFTGSQLMKIANGKTVDQVVQALRKSKAVEYVQPDYVILPSAFTPADPLFDQLWGLKNSGQYINGYYGTPGIDINVQQAWNTTQGSQDLVVGVIDSGVDINHPDLNNKIWTNYGEVPNDGIDNDGDGYVDDVNGWDFYNWDNTVFDPFDGDRHGTHVSGTIAASADNTGVIGVAPNVKIMPLKFIGPNGGSSSGAIEAIDYAKQKGVKLVNASWGGGGNDYALSDAIANSGMLFVAAAGNDGQDNDLYPHFPSSFTAPNILSVAAIDNVGNLAYFSNYGLNSVDIAAPGVGILSTVPKKAGQGAGIEVNGVSPSGPSYRAVVQGFGLQDFAQAAIRQEIMSKALTNMGVIPNSSTTTGDSVLVVQDDQSARGDVNVIDYYTSALAGYNYSIFTVGADDADGPILADLQQYKAVIWFTGESYGGMNYANLTPADQTNLQQYLFSGGNLYLSGPDVLYGIEDTDLVINTLYTNVLVDGINTRELSGVDSTAYAGSLYSLDGMLSPYNDVLGSNNSYAKVNLMWPGDADYSNAYEYFDGTSMATPHVTGAAALVMSAHPDYTPSMVKQTLMSTSVPLSSLTGKVVTGGMVNAGTAVTYSPDDDIPGIPTEGGQISGTLDQNNDLDDVFAIKLVKGEKVMAKMSSATPGTDFDLYLYDQKATTVKTSEGILVASENPNTSEEVVAFTAPADGTYYLDAYGYAGSGDYTLDVQLGATAGTYENTAPELSYIGPWQTVNDTNASGGSYASVNAAGSSVELLFNGGGIRLSALKGPNQGIAKVSIDGMNFSADLYSSAVQYNAVAFEKLGLSQGIHKIKIEWSGAANRAVRKTSTSINIDSLTVVEAQIPPAPTGLSATPGNGSVSLAWNGSDPNLNYNVYRSTASGSGYQKIASAVATTTFVDNSVSFGPTYYYIVKAVNQYGWESAPSNEAQAALLPPQPPTNLAAYVVNNQVQLTWTASSTPGVMYNVFRNGPSDPQGTYYMINASPIADTAYTDSSVTLGSFYSYMVASVDSNGQFSDPSNFVGITVLPNPPSEPTGVSASAGNSLVDVSWNPVPNAVSYNIYRNDLTLGGEVISSVSGTTFSDATVVNGNNYEYRVSAVDQYGQESSKSFAVTARPLPPGPTPPTGVTAAAGDGKISLNWTASTTDGVTYDVFRSSAAGGPYNQVNSSPISGTTYLDTGLINGTKYYYVLKSVDQYGQKSGTSAEVYATPAPAQPPAAPTELTASAVNSKVTLSWTASSTSGSSYNVYRSTIPGGPYTKLTATAVATTTYTDSVAVGTQYYYIVKAVVSSTESAASAEIGVNFNEETSSNATYTGTWSTASVSGASGGTQKYSNTVNSSVSLNFTGTSISVLGYKANVYGIADVYLDGTKVGTIDYYNSTPIFKQVLFEQNNLSNGSHTLKLVVTGTKNAASTNTYIDIDAFTVLVTPPSAPNAPTSLTSSAMDSKATLSWGSSSTPGVGYNVYRSTTAGGPYTKVNSAVVSGTTYTDAITSGTIYYYLVKAVDGNNVESAASNEVRIGFFEQTDPSAVYTGTWNTSTVTGASGGTQKYSNSVNANVAFSFTGSSISVIGYKANVYGIADVYIDGAKVGTIDYYNSSAVFKQTVFQQSNLSSGSHTIKLVVTGTKNSSSTNTYIDVDAFVVQ